MLKRSRSEYIISILVCSCCKGEFPIPRRKSHRREKDHIKTLYCPVCKTEREFTEYNERNFYKNLNGDEVNSVFQRI